MGLMPALERYDGPAFRVLRKYLRSEPIDLPLVRVVSAEHGLMTLDQPIAEYDQRMTPERAQELRPAVLAALSALIQEQPVREALVVVGQTYLLSLTGIEQVLDGVPVRIARETQGRKLGVLRAWLYGEESVEQNRQASRGARRQPRQPALISTAETTFTVSGRRFAVSADRVLSLAQQALADHIKQATRITRWYVPVEGGRIAAKWLVAQASGIPLGDFQTNAALSVLERLGVTVLDAGADGAPT